MLAQYSHKSAQTIRGIRGVDLRTDAPDLFWMWQPVIRDNVLEPS